MIARAHRTLLAVALGLPLAVLGCGGDDNGPGSLDRNDPEAVARAYIATYYDCGDRGAGLRWDLELHDGGELEISREDAVADERQEGCRPSRTPEVKTFRGGSRGELTEIFVTNPDACNSERISLVMVQDDEGYKVDPAESDLDAADCVRTGSTS
ncbi:MAG: hypothetical protein LC790_12300 [Actinobacteria bacterium]|nr:hypothetical protein [Actinomycetota bacterium]